MSLLDLHTIQQGMYLSLNAIWAFLALVFRDQGCPRTRELLFHHVRLLLCALSISLDIISPFSVETS